MRFIIYGAGGIGGTIGARLFQHGHDVLLIARGPHLKAIQQQGLIFKSPLETVTLPISCVGHPSNIEFREGDVVFMTTKGQHSLEALEVLRDTAGEDIPVICCQNGVANERTALRIFNRVYGMVVILPASHLEPGIVQTETKSITGILDAGCYPTGIDPIIEEVTKTLSGSNFDAIEDPNVMRWKYAKLLMNLGNSLQALCETGGGTQDIAKMMRLEALECYKAGGIDCADQDEVSKRRGKILQLGAVDGKERGGGSSWQSIVRGTGSIEADYLNGEIVLLGKLHGVATPANRVLQQLANRLAKEGGRQGSYTLDEIRQRIRSAGGEL